MVLVLGGRSRLDLADFGGIVESVTVEEVFKENSTRIEN